MNKEAVLSYLQEVQDPVTGKLLASSGRLDIVFSERGDLFLTITIQPTEEKLFQPIQAWCHKLLAPHVSGKTLVTLTAHGPAASPAPSPKPSSLLQLPNLKKIIALSSGKGGVGKSTIAFNLALAAAQSGLRAALIDADIYGPSLPLLVNHWEKPVLNAHKKMIPYEAHGLKMQSMGFLVPPQQPIIWRGPMASSGFQQLLTGTEWGEIDLMLIDLPPGTGDIHLTLCQKVPLHGAVIVTTPQDLALIDALKAVKMFETLKVPIVGLIENMSLLTCPHCKETIDVFGQGQGAKAADQHHLPFLGAIPLDLMLRTACDQGKPLITTDPYHPLCLLFKEIVSHL